jgi:hypothetical protein
MKYGLIFVFLLIFLNCISSLKIENRAKKLQQLSSKMSEDDSIKADSSADDDDIIDGEEEEDEEDDDDELESIEIEDAESALDNEDEDDFEEITKGLRIDHHVAGHMRYNKPSHHHGFHI